MKKIILFSLFLIAVSTGMLFAQSFSVPNSNYSYWGDPNNTATVSVPVTNTTNVNIDVMVEKTVNNLAPFHSSLFCFGIQCYDTSTNISSVISFTANSTETLLADLNKNGAIGLSCVTYRIKDINNINDFVDIEVCYNITATGISSVNKASTLSAPQPNPADRIAAINYNLSGDIKTYAIAIYDILGNKVKQINFSEKSGIMLLPTAEMNSGVYFYSLMSSNKVLSTNKLVVAH